MKGQIQPIISNITTSINNKKYEKPYLNLNRPNISILVNYYITAQNIKSLSWTDSSIESSNIIENTYSFQKTYNYSNYDKGTSNTDKIIVNITDINDNNIKKEIDILIDVGEVPEAKGSLTVSGNIDDIPDLEKFKNIVKCDISRISGIKKERIIIIDVNPGSIKVGFLIRGKPDPLEELNKIRQRINNNTIIGGGKVIGLNIIHTSNKRRLSRAGGLLFK